MGVERPDFLEEIESDVLEELKEPSLYKVLIHNDDYTPREFVVGVLMSVFQKSMAAATRLMLHTHKNGVGVCGIYTYEVAETKVRLSLALARDHGFPLKLTIEEE